MFFNLLAKLSLLLRATGRGGHSEAELAGQAAVLEGRAADLVGLRLAGAAFVSCQLALQALLLASDGRAADLGERDADGLKLFISLTFE